MLRLEAHHQRQSVCDKLYWLLCDSRSAEVKPPRTSLSAGKMGQPRVNIHVKGPRARIPDSCRHGRSGWRVFITRVSCRRLRIAITLRRGLEPSLENPGGTRSPLCSEKAVDATAVAISRSSSRFLHAISVILQRRTGEALRHRRSLQQERHASTWEPRSCALGTRDGGKAWHLRFVKCGSRRRKPTARSARN